MSTIGTCRWPIGNDQNILFNIHDSNDHWDEVGGLYIFAYRAKDDLWHALYAGQTDDFSSRLPFHERLDEAIQLGATHIHVTDVPKAAHRDILERRLIAHLQPPMNEQLRAVRSSAF
jgi:hypothetical protein